MSHDEHYDLKSVNLPRFAGTSLALLTALLENPLTRGFIANQVFKTGGISQLRTLDLTDPPTFKPHPHTTPAQASAVAESLQDSQDFLFRSTPPKGFQFETVADFARAYREGSLTPLQVAETVLAAVEDSNNRQPALRAVIACQHDDVLAQARASAERFRAGSPKSILDGVPVAVKDEVNMVPYGTSGGTSFLGRQPAKEDSTVVANMRRSGALLIGKTNMHEIGIGLTGCNPNHGTARNPYNPNHHTGGSSSGSAAAVAAGLVPLAIGADGGGSIRVPSAFCGVVGLKPTFGRVSEFGALPLNWSVAHLGPIGASVRDTAIGYLAMSGPDPRDPNSLHQPGAHLQGFDDLDLSGITLGVYSPWLQHATTEVVGICENLISQFSRMGAKIKEITIPELDAARIAHLITITTEMLAGLSTAYREHRNEFSLEIRYDLALARLFTSQDYVQAQRIRTRTIAHFEHALEQVDGIFTPATAIPAPAIRTDALDHGESDISQLTEIMRYVITANLTGHPAISFPAGYDSHGLPVGAQVIGGYWEEHLLLRLAHAAENLLERQSPKMNYRLLLETP